MNLDLTENQTEPKFGPQHWWAIAKDIRTEYAQTDEAEKSTFDYNAAEHLKRVTARRRALEDLAVRLAKRFQRDNPRFAPIEFLLRCSPDPDMYDFGELWQED